LRLGTKNSWDTAAPSAVDGSGPFLPFAVLVGSAAAAQCAQAQAARQV
jgi:hypothetical protein